MLWLRRRSIGRLGHYISAGPDGCNSQEAGDRRCILDGVAYT